MKHSYSTDVLALNPAHRLKSWPSEHAFQAAIIAECDLRAALQPEYGLIYAIPNGQYRKGQRMEPGLRAGMPDLCLPVARKAGHALYIELKVGDNEPSAAQIACMNRLAQEGNACVVIWDDVDEVIGMIAQYLERI